MNIPRTIDQIPRRQHNEDRLRRADSWFERSETAKDETERFIFLWIAFNAAYGYEVVPSDSDQWPVERKKFDRFLGEILKRDKDKVLEKKLWRTQVVMKCDDNGVLEKTFRRTYLDPIYDLLNNRYIFKPFWEAVRGSDTERGWEEDFSRSKCCVNLYMKKGNACPVLMELFMRLYTLRNQLIHGGATFEKGWGQDQVRDGSLIMASLVPSILKIMRADIEKNPESDAWEPVMFPRVNDGPR